MTKRQGRPPPRPRICAVCGKAYDNKWGWDCHLVDDKLLDSCSSECRAEKGWRDRFSAS